jgi:CRISPR-associated protein Csb2
LKSVTGKVAVNPASHDFRPLKGAEELREGKSLLALSVHYLAGRAVGKRYDSHTDPGWPPDPARLFYALTNGLHAGGNHTSERAALLWLEAQPPPSLWHSDWSERSPHLSYVPPNDVASIPEQRNKRERQFPSVTPEQPVVYFIWPDAEPPAEVREGLRSLAGRVTYLGHSSSLVSVNICDRAPAPRIVPGVDRTVHVLRVPRPGLLRALEQRFNDYAEALQRTHGVAPRLPLPTSFARYAEVRAGTTEIAHGEFTELHILSLPPGCRLPLTATLRIIEVMRNAAMALAEQPVIEELSGHRPDGSQSKKERAAFVPLPHIDHRYADGHLLGIGVALPRLNPDIRLAVLAPISRVRCLTLGAAGAWPLTPALASDARGLQPATWTRPARRWASVTPIVLHRYPHRGEYREIIAGACLHAGLPTPNEIIATPAAPFIGGAPAREFRGIQRRAHVHAILCFDRAVRGPIVLGAGRYQGYGLLRPMEAA